MEEKIMNTNTRNTRSNITVSTCQTGYISPRFGNIMGIGYVSPGLTKKKSNK
jgi:glycine cleavage system aminomethyltransferase T